MKAPARLGLHKVSQRPYNLRTPRRHYTCYGFYREWRATGLYLRRAIIRRSGRCLACARAL